MVVFNSKLHSPYSSSPAVFAPLVKVDGFWLLLLMQCPFHPLLAVVLCSCCCCWQNLSEMTSSDAPGVAIIFAGGICHHDFSLLAVAFIIPTLFIPTTQIF